MSVQTATGSSLRHSTAVAAAAAGCLAAIVHGIGQAVKTPMRLSDLHTIITMIIIIWYYYYSKINRFVVCNCLHTMRCRFITRVAAKRICPHNPVGLHIR